MPNALFKLFRILFRTDCNRTFITKSESVCIKRNRQYFKIKPQYKNIKYSPRISTSHGVMYR